MRRNDKGRQELHVRHHASHRVDKVEPEQLGSVLRRLVGSTRLRDVFKNRLVYRKWGELVDSSVAEKTRAIGFKRGTLVVACRTQALASELAAFRKGEFLDIMKTGLGEGVVEDIKFVVEGNGGERS
jgi:predicted nucleic acid-binding Zn ribbon protein